MKLKSFFLFCFVLSGYIPNAQIENKNLFPTPNAAGLGQYGQVATDLFTGLPNINIPIYTFKSRDLSIPISLSYLGGGIKPSEHSSWVGLAWNLHAGGLITRIQHDMPDEYVDCFIGVDNGAQINRGFFYNYGYLAASNWADPSSLAYDEARVYPDFYSTITGPNVYFQYPDRVDLEPDEFQFDFLGMSGTLMMGQDGQWNLISKGGLSFSVSTEIGQYAVWEPTSRYPSGIRYCLTRFILTAADGTKYYFGADQSTFTGAWGADIAYFSSGDSTAIEFSRIGVGTGDFKVRDGGVVPVSWYLTKIQSPTGDVITLTYTRNGYQILVHSRNYGALSYCDVCGATYDGGNHLDDDVTVLDGITLSGIYGANGSVVFDKSKANILDYSMPQYNPLALSPSEDHFVNKVLPAYGYEEFWTGNSPITNWPVSTFMKLDGISIRDNNNNVVKSYKFSYTENPNNRLFLNSLTEVGRDGTTLPSYTFTYNNIAGLASVPYETMKVDHWGYYNGVDPTDPATGIIFPLPSNATSAYNSTFASIYANNRSPMSTSMKLGVLTQISYPTGGFTSFSWEPNNFSKYIDQTPTTGNTPNIAINDLRTDQTGAGLRIHQITSNAGFGSQVTTKTYDYYRDYVNNQYLSSGVLNSPLPQYVSSYEKNGSTNSSTPLYTTYSNLGMPFTQITYRKWSSDNLLPLHYTNGAPVTYTNVAEINSDGGFTTYTYTNHDNGYLNKLPVGGLVDGFFSITSLKGFNSSSMELERGLMLSEKTYGVGSVPLLEKDYQYNDDPARFNSAIHKVYCTRDFSMNSYVAHFDNNGFVNVSYDGPVAYKSDNIFALNTYAYYPYLKKLTAIQNDQTGHNPVTTVTIYAYDNYRNKKSESFTSSTGETVTTNYNYANDAITGLSTAAQTGKAGLLSAHMIGLPLEKTVVRGSTQQEHTRADYQAFQNMNAYIVPLASFQAVNGNPLDGLTQYVNYDQFGNITEFSSRSGAPTSFDWGYHQAYPTVKVVNASNTARQITTQSQGQASNTMYFSAGVFAMQLANFSQTSSGNISLFFGFGEYPGNATAVLYYSLTGPVNQSGTLCISGSGSGCSFPSSITFSNMPAGQYFFSLTPSSNYSINTFAIYHNQTAITTPSSIGSKEYFYEGFEEDASSSVTGGGAHTGDRYWVGSSYTPDYVLPTGTARSFTIQWWSLSGGTWTMNQKPYTGSTTLTGPVDDIRIFPTDALISTYTYKPFVGLTSELDVNGKAKYYEYDEFGRLAIVRDQDRNILKKYCYTMAGQTENFTITPQIPVNISNTTNRVVKITFANIASGVNYSFTINPTSSISGTIPSASYDVNIEPASPSGLYPIVYSLNSYMTSYYGAVEMGDVLLNDKCTITIDPLAPTPFYAQNTTSKPVTLTFTNLTTNISYTYTINPGGYSSGTVPNGTYNIFLGPTAPQSNYNIKYTVYSSVQIYYAVVEYGGVPVTSNCTITIEPSP